ncbi:MAG TPA: DNA-directed RNA polymerase subunit omega [Firmicutes bacterium]|nr:DNA-directed RNA polymerase subunit omega [Bacillota bacterium]
MLNPAIGELIKEYESRYQLVLDVAKRARHISEEAEAEHQIITEKPVSLAIDQIAEAKREEAEHEA